MTGQRFKTEFHCHTYHSADASAQPRGLIAACQRRGINCLAITDHNSVRGAFEVQALAPFMVIVGEEIRTTEGEIIGLFLSEEVPRDLTPAETVRRIRGQGGLVYIPHPFDRLRRARLSPAAIAALVEEIDVIEVLNARITLWRDVELAYRFAAAHGLAIAAGSDAHVPWEVGRAYVDMPAFADRNDFLAALRQGRIVGQLSPPWIHLSSTLARWRKWLRR